MAPNGSRSLKPAGSPRTAMNRVGQWEFKERVDLHVYPCLAGIETHPDILSDKCAWPCYRPLCLLELQDSPPQIHPFSEGWSIMEMTNSTALIALSSELIHAPHALLQAAPHQVQPIPRLITEAVSIINWDAVDALMSAPSPARCGWTTKHGFGNCGVGLTIQFWKEQYDNAFAWYGAAEDATHILMCQGQQFPEIWNTNLDTFHTAMVGLFSPSYTRRGCDPATRCLETEYPLCG
jgi:hypothetical protein